MHRILIVGVGSIGERHVRCMIQTGRAQVGICDPDVAVRQTVAERYQVHDSFDDLEQALQQQWDAAVIATPAPLHVPIARQLAAEGVGLLVEKPLAVDEQGVAELVQAVEQAQLSAAIAYVYRAHPAVQGMRAALQAGQFGRILQIVHVCGQSFPAARPNYREIYYARREQGGGVIQDGLTHTFNLCEWLAGPITRIAVDAGRLQFDGVECEDTVNVLARHDERVLASYAINHHQAPSEYQLKVVCQGGTMSLDIRRHAWKWLCEPGGAWTQHPPEVRSRDEWFGRQATAFLDQLDGTGEALCSLREGWQTLRVNRAALASADQQGQWQRLEQPAIVS